MKIGSISDIHVDYNARSARMDARGEFIEAMRRGVTKHDVNVLVVAGDVSGDVDLSIDVIDELNSFVRTLWVPGNHEFWSNDSERVLTKVIDHQHSLVDRLVEIDGVQFIGSPAWYNYRFAKAPVGICRANRDKLWGDRNCSWGRGDVEVHDDLLARLESTLVARDHSRPTVVATHMVPFREAMTYVGPSVTITDGYMGSPELGELLVRERVDLSLFGHTHIKSVGAVDGVRYVCSPVGYTFEWGGLSGQRPFFESLAISEV